MASEESLCLQPPGPHLNCVWSSWGHCTRQPDHPHACAPEKDFLFWMSLQAYQGHRFLEGPHTAFPITAVGLAVWAPSYTQMRQPGVWIAHTLAPQQTWLLVGGVGGSKKAPTSDTYLQTREMRPLG